MRTTDKIIFMVVVFVLGLALFSMLGGLDNIANAILEIGRQYSNPWPIG